jgi:hypothetical protein
MPVALRSDFNAPAVRAAAKRSKDGPQTRRLLAVAAIYDGATRTQAAALGGVTLQIVRDWVVKFNASGPMAWSTARRRDNRLGSTTRIAQRSRRSSRAGQSHPFMASCAGASSICANGCSTSMTSRSRNRR